ncbi:hypothetical protein ACFCY8_30200 [Streptomyces noursei]|uniref:hypothetical protein n=1 Tax=Streptomyces noursei TaxID=1971 RepID=UPI0035D59C6A
MDAGIAAVCGALAGAVATVGASFATGRSQREGARIAARTEHQRQRREKREPAYSELIDAANALRQATGMLWPFYEPGGSSGFTPERLDAYRDCVKRLQAAWKDVHLAGPKAVSIPATRIKKAAESTQWAVTMLEFYKTRTEIPGAQQEREIHALALAEAIMEIVDLIPEFADLAQEALDDAGV